MQQVTFYHPPIQLGAPYIQSKDVHPLYEDVKPASLQEPYQLTVCSAYGVSTAK